MLKATLCVALVALLAIPALAADVSKASSEGAKTQDLNVVPVSELLAKAAKSSLGLGEAHLLRAVADLIDKEQATIANGSQTSRCSSVAVAPAAPIAEQATRSVPVRTAKASGQRKRLVVRLRNALAVDVAEGLEGHLDKTKIGRPNGDIRDANHAALVPEQLTNSLLISGTPEDVDSLIERIAELASKPLFPPKVVRRLSLQG